MSHDMRPLALDRVGQTLFVLCLICAAQVKPALAGTDGFGLGLRELPAAADSPPSSQEWSDITEQRPLQPVNLLPPAFEQPPAYPIRLRDDFFALAMAPLEWDRADWRKLGLGVLAVGAVSLLDEEINSWADRTRSQSSVKLVELYRPIGENGTYAIIGATWLAGRAMGRPELTAVAEDSLEATLIAAGVITPLLKATIGRNRPRDTDQAYSFSGSGGSFPSGETTQAFAVASVIAAHSQSRWVKAVAWGSAGLVGLGRIELDGHWASDVVAGALIGAAVGRWVVRRNRPELSSGLQMTWAPAIGREQYGLAMHISF